MMYQGYFSNGTIIPEKRRIPYLEENQLVYIIPTKTKKGKTDLAFVKTGKNHAAGILKKYANPSLIESEREVFEDALVARHSNA